MMHETTTQARMTDDGERSDDVVLLRRYADSRSEEAFAELVRRRIGLVYSVALRHTGDAHRAEDVTQAVFVALARKAGELARRPVLVGWLYRSAQFAASDAVRVEVRRQAREQQVYTMNEIERESPAPDWERLRAVLDEGLGDLEERDRDAVLLRYFDGQPFAEVGAKLGLSENTARMRVERALEKLHGALARRGVKSTAAALGLALAGQGGVAAPVGLAASVTAAALAGVGAVSAGLVGIKFMNMIKPMVVPVGVGVGVALVVTVFLAQGRANAAWREEIVTLLPQESELARLEEENAALVRVAVEVAALRQDDAELARLRDEAADLRERMKLRMIAARSAAQTRVFVAGAVGTPGVHDYPPTGQMTLDEVIKARGGLNRLADRVRISIKRVQPNGEVRTWRVDLENGGGTFALEAGDVVNVPEKIL